MASTILQISNQFFIAIGLKQNINSIYCFLNWYCIGTKWSLLYINQIQLWLDRCTEANKQLLRLILTHFHIIITSKRGLKIYSDTVDPLSRGTHGSLDGSLDGDEHRTDEFESKAKIIARDERSFFSAKVVFSKTACLF